MKALVLHPPRDFFPYGEDSAARAVALFRARAYEIGRRIDMPGCELVGEAAAEECFDLTNNPMRQEEREVAYGRHRSISVGDIVILKESLDAYLCASAGWIKVE